MIRGVHTMMYTDDPEATRAFLRDKLQLAFTDVGDGWLIFGVEGGEVGCHPLTEKDPKPYMDFSFYCDDIESTMSELAERGVEFDGDVQDAGWGHITHIPVPGGLKVMLYQPKYRMG